MPPHRGGGVPVTEAALAEPLAVCCRAVTRAVQVGGDLAGKRVLDTGSGPIGVLCAALAHHHGAAEIMVTDLYDATLEIARAVGASKTINVLKTPEALEVYQVEKGQFDLAFECSAAETAVPLPAPARWGPSCKSGSWATRRYRSTWWLPRKST